MKNIYRLLIFCSLWSPFFASLAYGQANFRPGYVLPLTGDTLRGEVDLREGGAGVGRCLFRPNSQAAPTTYLPAQLRGYGLDAENRYYRTLSVGEDPSQLFFLEILAAGPVSLYFLRDAQHRDEYYVGREKQPLALLKHGMVQVSQGSERSMVMETGYRNTLAAVLADCPAVQKQLPRLSFQETQLIKVVSTYNQECAGYKPTQRQSTAAKSHLSLGVLVGAAQQTLTYSGYPYSLDATSRQTHSGVVGGPVIQVHVGRLSQRISLVTAVLYETEKYEIEGEGANSNGFSGIRFRHQFDLAYLRLPVMIRYTYPRGKVFPMAEAGFTVAYAIKANTIAEQMDNNGKYTPTNRALSGVTGDGFVSTQTALGAGLGVGTHAAGGRAISLLVRAERTNGFSNSAGISTNVVHLYGLLSFDLTK